MPVWPHAGPIEYRYRRSKKRSSATERERIPDYLRTLPDIEARVKGVVSPGNEDLEAEAARDGGHQGEAQGSPRERRQRGLRTATTPERPKGRGRRSPICRESTPSEESFPQCRIVGVIGPECREEPIRVPSEDKESAEADSEHITTLPPKAGGKPHWTPEKGLKRLTCERATRKAILEQVPQAQEDRVLFRYVVYALWTTWRDGDTDLRVISAHVLHWIGHHRFWSGIEVIRHIEGYLDDFAWIAEIPKERARLIEHDGLPEELHEVVREDLRTSTAEYSDRVKVLEGTTFQKKNGPTNERSELKDHLPDADEASSKTSRFIWRHMNDRGPRHFVRMKKHLPEAHAALDQSDYAPENRRQYRIYLRAIQDQPKPFYKYSSNGRTDRIFSLNHSVLRLPKKLRYILCQGLYDVDLESAHLKIAAWLWDAHEVLEKLVADGFSIWESLMRHFQPLFRKQDYQVPEPGTDKFACVKGPLKRALYSTVYGKPAANVQGMVTRQLSPLLGDKVGEHFRSHPIIHNLLERRDEKLKELEVGQTVRGPTGSKIVVQETLEEEGDGIGPKSALAFLAQSYEQELMRVILDFEKKFSSPHFKTILWIHDGAYVKLRSTRGRKKDLNRCLRERSEELAEFAEKDTPLPASFDVEEVTPPDVPHA